MQWLLIKLIIGYLKNVRQTLKESVICIEIQVYLWGEWQISMTVIKYTSYKQGSESLEVLYTIKEFC